MPLYMIKPGVTFGKDNSYIPGDTIEMSEMEATPFYDKLEPVAEDVAVVQSQPENGLSDRITHLLFAASVTDDMLSLMSDDELTGIDGIGASSLTTIRELYPEIK